MYPGIQLIIQAISTTYEVLTKFTGSSKAVLLEESVFSILIDILRGHDMFTKKT